MCCLLLLGEGALCSIPIENILAVERLEEESFKMKNVRCLTQNSLCKYVDPPFKFNLFSPFPDVPSYPARASTLHPGQQLRGSSWLDRHPHQSQPVQPQTPKHLPSFSLPQWPLAVLQALSRHSSRMHTLHWVRNVVRILLSIRFHSLPLNVSMYFQGSSSKHPAGRRWRQRDWENLLPLQHIHDQTDQNARSDTDIRVIAW